MFNRLRLTVFFVIMGVVLPCLGRPRAAAHRKHGRRSKEVERQRMPLDDLVSQADWAVARGDLKQALGLYRRICKDHKKSDKAPGAYYNRGVLYEKDCQFTSAIRMFAKIVKRYPESVWFMQAVERYFQIAKKLQAGVRPRYFGAFPGFRDYDFAVKNYELVVKYAPYSRYAPPALIEIANLHVRGKCYDLAIAALERLVDGYPDSVEVPDAYLKIAEIYSGMVKGDDYNQGGAVAARRYYGEFCALFPGHERVSFARSEMEKLTESIVRSKVALGDFYFNAFYNAKAAKILYRLAIGEASAAVGAQIAREKIQAIAGGARPKTTPFDFLFPRYEPQIDDEN